ncbi:MAG: PIN domain-containing protein [Actinobacteria bacterium]|nr:PIN domain-containing protein [Actinomycetota bacterium]
MLVLDTSGLLAALDAGQRFHVPAREALAGHDGSLLLSPFVLAELDYLLATRVSRSAEIALLDEVGRGVYSLEPFSARDVAEAARIMERYADLGIGLADASVVVLANRYNTLDLLTLDERLFRVLRGPRDRPFRLLPSDAV